MEVSTDSTLKIVKSYPVKFFVDTYGTLGHQRNLGIDQAAGKYIAFTDADCIVEQLWLSKLISAIEKSHKRVVGVCGPNLVFGSDPTFAKVVGYAQETFLGSGGSCQCFNPTKILVNANSASNCNAIYKRDILSKIKYDDTISYGEDADLNYRLKKIGYRFLYYPNIIVWHHRSATLKCFIAKMFTYGGAMAVISRKNHAIVRWYAYFALFCLLALISYFIISIVNRQFTLLLLLLAVYLFCLILVTFKVAKKIKNISALLCLIVLPIQHVVYSFGFIKGLLAGKKLNR